MIFENPEQVAVGDAGIKGKSLYARHAFKKGDIVLVISGSIVNYATDYTIPIDHELKIEPRIPGSESQYLCHSCEPNVGIKNRTLLVAMRDIAEGEEITTSYAFLGYAYGEEKTIDNTDALPLDLTCHCGTASCHGHLQCYKWMPPAWRAEYREYVSEYLLDDDRYPYIPFE